MSVFGLILGFPLSFSYLLQIKKSASSFKVHYNKNGKKNCFPLILNEFIIIKNIFELIYPFTFIAKVFVKPQFLLICYHLKNTRIHCH